MCPLSAGCRHGHERYVAFLLAARLREVPSSPGWGRNDVITLAVNAWGSTCYCFFGNVARLSSLIVRGDLISTSSIPGTCTIWPEHRCHRDRRHRLRGFGVLALVRPNLVQAGLFGERHPCVSLLWLFGDRTLSLVFHRQFERFSEQASFSLIHFRRIPPIFGDDEGSLPSSQQASSTRYR